MPVGGAYRGYGPPSRTSPLETAMDEIAERLGIDPIELRRRNHIQVGRDRRSSVELGEGKRGRRQTVKSCGLETLSPTWAPNRFGWEAKRGSPDDGTVRGATGSGSRSTCRDRESR